MKHRHCLIILLLILCATAALGTEQKRTRGWPELKISGVLDQDTADSPLIFMLQIRIPADATPFNISSGGLSARIYKHKRPWQIFSAPERLYDGEVAYHNGTNTIIRIEPGETKYLMVSTYRDRRSGDTISSVPRGSHEFRVYLIKDETQQHDYQWRGQTFSPPYKLMLQDN